MKPEQRRFVVGVYFTEEVGLSFLELGWQTRIREAGVRLGRPRAKKGRQDISGTHGGSVLEGSGSILKAQWELWEHGSSEEFIK